MSKLNPDVLADAIKDVLKYSKTTKPRKFLETVELQIGLKNYDPAKDKRFAGTMVLPNECKRSLNLCVLGDQVHCDAAAAIKMPFLSVEDMKALKKDKKKVKELAAKYDGFLASDSVIRRIPRLLGPGLNKAGKFPTLLREGDDLAAKQSEAKCTVKFQLKKVVCLSCAIGNVGQTDEELSANITLACNFLVSMLKKHWQVRRGGGGGWWGRIVLNAVQNLRSIHIKSTMGPVQRIF